MANRTVKAIETSYKGYLFRSRLEARWAVYLDVLGLKWEYEVEGYDFGELRYLPDFWLSQVRLWAEVKPGPFDAEAVEKCRRLVYATGHECILLEGTPECRAYPLVCKGDWGPDFQIETGTTISDCVLSMYHNYPIDEHRFYSGTGGLMEDDFRADGMFGDVPGAVQTARRQRFQGVNPEPLWRVR
jgi:hypothetical protein